MIAVQNDRNEIIGEVEPTQNLDHWDGRNYTDGSVGHHLGLAQLENGEYVLVRTTQWQNEQDSAKIITADAAVKLVLRAGAEHLFKEFPELEEIREKNFLHEAKTPKTRSFSVRVNFADTPEKIEEKLAEMKKKIGEFLQA